jgi:hypothetical protein
MTHSLHSAQGWREAVKKQIVRWLGSDADATGGNALGADGLAAVGVVPVGRADDGLVLRPAGTPIDKPWHELFQEFEDAREAWRKNPLARRLVGLVTSYTVGNGITLHSEKRDLQRFISDFWQHNQLDLRVDEWCDELSRSGELFPVLFTNPVSGLSTLRTVPACLIRAVDFDPEDYERERRYQESVGAGEREKWWIGVGNQAINVDPPRAEIAQPLMLHYAVNRPTGAVRGESDLAPILPWLRRYNRWLEDRVRLNAAMRAFLWVVKVPARLRPALEERYRTPPEAGSVIIAEEGAETWEAVAPNLHAADAEKDGRAIRWMIVAGGPGTALLDLGEGEDSNLATGQAMAEQRRRFLRRRQAYLVWLLIDLTLHAYARYRVVNPGKARVTAVDIQATTPDISPEDNQSLASAAVALANSLEGMARLVGQGPTFRSMALRLFMKFIGETVGQAEMEQMLTEGEPHPRPEGAPAPQFGKGTDQGHARINPPQVGAGTDQEGVRSVRESRDGQTEPR